LLRDRYHRFYLLRPNSTRGDRRRWTRGYIANHGGESSLSRLPDITLKGLDGKDVRFPVAKNDKLTLLLFIEPPAEAEPDFPVVKGPKGFVPKRVFVRRDYIRKVVEDATNLSEKHVNKDLNVVLAFLCDDAKRVEYLMETNSWSGQVVMVPGGLKNPLVHRLGIFSADTVPNIFLLRRDGSIAWHTSGFHYKSEFGYPFAVLLGMKVNIEVSEVEYAYRALERGDFKGAARVFTGPYTPWRPERYDWRPARYHGKALACMGLKDWESALEAIDTAIDAHNYWWHRRGREPRNILDWRKSVTEDYTIETPCDVIEEFWSTKVIVLDKLNRKKDADAVRRRLKETVEPCRESIYKTFHEKLKKWRAAFPSGSRLR
jgi:hypothetical protein